jgi:hypothetical protein
MTAFLIAVLLLRPLGLGLEDDSTARWWLERVAWVGMPALVLAGLVGIFGRFERPRLPRAGARPPAGSADGRPGPR